MPTDTIFQMTGSTVRFGDGATREVGTDFVDLGCRRVLAFIDPAVRAGYPGESAGESLRAAGGVARGISRGVAAVRGGGLRRLHGRAMRADRRVLSGSDRGSLERGIRRV